MFWEELIFWEGVYVIAAIICSLIVYKKARIFKFRGEFWHVFLSTGSGILLPVTIVVAIIHFYAKKLFEPVTEPRIEVKYRPSY